MKRCCALAGMSATYPLDMVRGRLTVQSMQGNHRYRGIMHATSVIIKEVRSMPAHPIIWQDSWQDARCLSMESVLMIAGSLMHQSRT